MNGHRAKSLRRAIGYDMKLDRHPNHELSRQYGINDKGATVVRGLRSHYQYIKDQYKRNTTWRRTL
jgi:hypothetical protein